MTRGVYLHGIATHVPGDGHEQGYVLEVMSALAAGDRRAERLLRRIYTHSGIDRRHTVLPDFSPGAEPGLFYDAGTRTFGNPTTGERNDLYTEAAKRLYPCVARRALDGTPGFTAEDVTHVITVSCTGFFAPGPDYHVVRELGLRPSTQRYHLGFMGCYAALPALRLARDIARSDPTAVVLVVSLELCTLHLQLTTDPDSLISGSVFADGAAAALVSAREPNAPGALELVDFDAALVPSGEHDMAWTIRDHGFEMVLSTYVPQILEANVAEAVRPLLERNDLERVGVPEWAVHPGGRAILDRVEEALALPADALDASRETLRRYGNMSSATVLFVLERLMRQGGAAGPVLAMAFGPGLTVESALLRRAS